MGRRDIPPSADDRSDGHRDLSRRCAESAFHVRFQSRCRMRSSTRGTLPPPCGRWGCFGDPERSGEPWSLSQALGMRAMFGFLAGDGIDEPSLLRALELEEPKAAVPFPFRASAERVMLLGVGSSSRPAMKYWPSAEASPSCDFSSPQWRGRLFVLTSERILHGQPVVVGTSGEVFREHTRASGLARRFNHQRVPV